MAADDEKSFFKTPLGYLIIAILCIIALMILISLFDKGGKPSRAHNNNYSNNNYFRRGQVPPSLAGYI
jgi:hypothetical protein